MGKSISPQQFPSRAALRDKSHFGENTKEKQCNQEVCLREEGEKEAGNREKNTGRKWEREQDEE